MILIQAFDCVPGTLVGESEEKGEADNEIKEEFFHFQEMVSHFAHVAGGGVGDIN